MGPKGISRVVNRGLARQYHQGFLPWTVARDGRFCHFGHPDPTWRTCGALMPGPQREPGWVTASESSYSKGIGSVASSLPLAGPNKGSFLEILSQYQFGLKQPIFSCQLLGDNGGAISLAQRGVGTRCEGSMGSHCWLASERLGFQELACGWAGHLPYGQGFRVRTEQGMGCV